MLNYNCKTPGLVGLFTVFFSKFADISHEKISIGIIMLIVEILTFITIPSLTVINVKNAINHDVERVSGIFVLLIGVVCDSIFSFQR